MVIHISYIYKNLVFRAISSLLMCAKVQNPQTVITGWPTEAQGGAPLLAGEKVASDRKLPLRSVWLCTVPVRQKACFPCALCCTLVFFFQKSLAKMTSFFTRKEKKEKKNERELSYAVDGKVGNLLKEIIYFYFN